MKRGGGILKIISDVTSELLKINIGEMIYTFITGMMIFAVGGVDDVFVGLLTFMIFDYATGVIKGAKQTGLNSQVARAGVVKKFMILVVVAMSTRLDIILGMDTRGINCRYVIICFYIGTEGLSILENIALMGVPVPNKLKKILEQAKERKIE